jgi:prephenate dehydratase
MKISILGPRGTFSEEAAHKFSKTPELLLGKDMEEIFESVLSRKADYGIVPVENSLEGSVGVTLELLQKKDTKICGEIILNIRHSLVALPSVGLPDIKEIISHPHALAQCKNFIRNLKANTRSFHSTAEAAREIAQQKLKNVAAIAPKIAAQLYNLKILKEDIQDENRNQTRFLVIATEDHEKTGRDKTSIILGLKDRPGALYDALEGFALEKINLTKIESRPSRKALGDYVFYIDFEGHRKDARVRKVLRNLKKRVAFMKILGSYPLSRNSFICKTLYSYNKPSNLEASYGN